MNEKDKDCPIRRCEHWNPEERICREDTCEECKYTFRKICEVCEEPTCELSSKYDVNYYDGNPLTWNTNFEM
jgi:hypothetical protein